MLGLVFRETWRRLAAANSAAKSREDSVSPLARELLHAPVWAAFTAMGKREPRKGLRKPEQSYCLTKLLSRQSFKEVFVPPFST